MALCADTTGTLPLVTVAVGIVCNAHQQFLVCLRPQDKEHAGFWEFPGGKLESGETTEQALHRELWEEVGITVQKARPFLQKQYVYPATGQKSEKSVFLDVWWVSDFTGVAYGRESQQIAWVNREELKNLRMLTANHSILAAI